MWIGKTFTFEAAHHLPGHPKCGKVHGHTYKLTVSIKGEPIKGMVVDFSILKEVVMKEVGELDHTDLNLIDPFPTVETLVSIILKKLVGALTWKDLPLYLIRGVRVRLQEGEGGWAEEEDIWI